ncbi:MAG: nuclear transport factor 2 family protein [Chromatiales bacterium]
MARHYDSAAAAEKAFYQAFRELNIDRMREIWVDSPAVYCIHPSGQLFRGRESILDSWAGMFQVAEKPHIQYSLINQSRHAGLAVHLVVERIGPTATIAQADAVVFATNVYQLTEAGWRMLGHHAAQARLEPTSQKVRPKLH